jgi:hypothetical protein
MKNINFWCRIVAFVVLLTAVVPLLPAKAADFSSDVYESFYVDDSYVSPDDNDTSSAVTTAVNSVKKSYETTTTAESTSRYIVSTSTSVNDYGKLVSGGLTDSYVHIEYNEETQNYSYNDTKFKTDDIYGYYNGYVTREVVTYTYIAYSDGTLEEKSSVTGYKNYPYKNRFLLTEMNFNWEYSSPAEAYKALCPNADEDIDAQIHISGSTYSDSILGVYVPIDDSFTIHIYGPESTATTTAITTTTTKKTTTTTTTTTRRATTTTTNQRTTTTTTTTTTHGTTTTDIYVVSTSKIDETHTAGSTLENIHINQYYTCTCTYTDIEFNTNNLYLSYTVKTFVTDFPYIIEYSDGSREYARDTSIIWWDSYEEMKPLNEVDEFTLEYSSPAEAYKALCPNADKDIDVDMNISGIIKYPYKYGGYATYDFSDTITVHINGPVITTTTTTTTTTSTTTITTTSTTTTTTTTNSTPTLIPGSLTMQPGDTSNLIPINIPSGSTVQWASNNTSVVTVSDGKVKAVGEGKATVYAVCGDTLMTCNVTVSSSTILYGDVDGDGQVLISDAVRVMSYVGNPTKYSLTTLQLDRADVNARGDGVGNMDSLAIQKFCAQVIPSLPES